MIDKIPKEQADSLINLSKIVRFLIFPPLLSSEHKINKLSSFDFRRKIKMAPLSQNSHQRKFIKWVSLSTF